MRTATRFEAEWYEGALIKQALAKTNRRSTEAVSQLTLSYQALAYIIDGRHKDLLKHRTSDPPSLTKEIGIAG